MRRKHLDLIIALVIAAVNVGWILLPNRPVIGTILCGLPLILLVPGYTLTEALFVQQSDAATVSRIGILRPFGTSDRLVLSLGLSLALVIIDGLLLSILPMGLVQPSWAVSLAVLSTVFSLIALYRRRAMSTNTSQKGSARLLRFTFYEGLLFLLTLVIVVSAFLYSTLAAQQQQQQSTFTQFWMVQAKQTNHSCAVLIGIQSFEASSTQYKVVLLANGSQLHNWPAVTLAPKQQWYQSVTLNSGDIESAYIDAQLYRLDKPGSIYRETHITLNSSGGSNGGKLVC
jgi:uncharacterized membrane protein